MWYLEVGGSGGFLYVCFVEYFKCGVLLFFCFRVVIFIESFFCRLICY